ncbi:MAG: glycosyltransferase [Pseudomonadales bacterium]|nr:glycosyltransferase [Pseudomonadales bacterium]
MTQTLLLITDAWLPQTNGVVTTWQTVITNLESRGVSVQVVHAGLFRTWPLPTYPEIKIARNPWLLKSIIREVQPDAVHIATEGPLGVYARQLFNKCAIPYTTSLHTKFPEYVQERIRLPLSVGYAFMRWFHRFAQATMCTTPSHKEELERWGLQRLVVWGRGVDVARFHQEELTQRDRPRALYVGRVAVEKNIEAFLSLEMDIDKIVVGDGPLRQSLSRKYPEVEWLGYKYDAELVHAYAQADVFVFPSLTDTFGLVMLEANACGTPIAAYPVTGPVDVVVPGSNGATDQELAKAVDKALLISRDECRAHAERHTWPVVVERLRENLVPIDWQLVLHHKLS